MTLLADSLEGHIDSISSSSVDMKSYTWWRDKASVRQSAEPKNCREWGCIRTVTVNVAADETRALQHRAGKIDNP